MESSERARRECKRIETEISCDKAPIERHPEIYDDPLSIMLGSMPNNTVQIPKDKIKKTKYILAHSGDLILFSSKTKKIKSEFDD